MVNDGPALGSMWQGEYLLQAALGDPAHGVFRAQRRRDSSSVALRLWRAPNDHLASQFLEHASSACSVHHPALAQVEACGREEQFCFVVSEYVVGQKLDTWADQVGIPPLGEVVELMRRVCDGLQLAARSGVLHSALHPRNLVMLQAESAANRRQQPKLLDLGVPSFARPRQPHALQAHFMAPELLTCVIEPGEPPLPATTAAMNVYSCGCLLHYLCTGQPPFQSDTLGGLTALHTAGAIAVPSQVNRDIPPHLERVIAHALERDPKKRIANPGALAASLSHVESVWRSSGVRRKATVPPPPPPAAKSERASKVPAFDLVLRPGAPTEPRTGVVAKAVEPSGTTTTTSMRGVPQLFHRPAKRDEALHPGRTTLVGGFESARAVDRPTVPPERDVPVFDRVEQASGGVDAAVERAAEAPQGVATVIDPSAEVVAAEELTTEILAAEELAPEEVAAEELAAEEVAAEEVAAEELAPVELVTPERVESAGVRATVSPERVLPSVDR
ncbi:MAG TPA: serine/threonine-protein kinase, partial [Polyangiales bacterium]|nr:serine/threonine-protein kinase [Polyangiales bacterium]